MKVILIDNIEQFYELKKSWDDIYEADPDATAFVSWPWLLGWAESIPHNWMVLAAKPDDKSPYVGFMALGIHSLRKKYFNNHSKLFIGGNPLSDNTGFVCLPDYAERAIQAFAAFTQKRLKWDTFSMRNVSDPRIDLFLRNLSSKRFEIREQKSISCPYIMLPQSWDEYLQKFLGAATRRTIKYDIRKFESLDEFRVTDIRPDDIENQIETLITLWLSRWGLRYDDSFMGMKTEDILTSYRLIFRRCFENNILWLRILWDGTIPIAGLAGFLDRKTGSFYSYVTASDLSNPKYTKLSPGKVMFSNSIRYAIEKGFKIYDFCAGNETYKFSFGVQERFSRNVLILRETYSDRLKKRVPVKLKDFAKALLKA